MFVCRGGIFRLGELRQTEAGSRKKQVEEYMPSFTKD